MLRDPNCAGQPTADIRLLVLDIDGTLVDASNRIRNSAIRAIHSAQRRGIAVAIATGRMYRTTLEVAEAINATLPLICYEGALIRQPHTELVHRHWPLEPRLIAELLDQVELFRGGRLSVHFYIEDHLYVSNLCDASLKYLDGSILEPIVVRDLRPLLNLAVTKVIVLSDDAQTIGRLGGQLQHLSGRNRIKEYNSVHFVEIFHRDVDKRLAVTHLAEELLSLRPENVMTIGDDQSDIEMLQYAGIGVAMGNASTSVKAAADWVTDTVEEDGVASAVEKWILDGTSGSHSQCVTIPRLA